MFFVAVKMGLCTQLPSAVGNATYYTMSDNIGSYAVYTCNDGFYFPLWFRVHSIVCINGKWPDVWSECLRKLLYNNCCYYI